MRAFIAIELPKEVEEQLKLEQAKLKDIGKLTFPQEFHLTLKFLREIDEDTTELCSLLKEIKFKPFEFSLEKPGLFPNEDYIRVIWIGINPENEAIELQKQIESKLEKFKIKKDYEFIPHITLARVKFIKPEDKEKLKKVLQKLEIPKDKIKIDSFKLIKSELTREGPVYEVVEEFGLG